ncbi:hypothetical protein D3C80_1505630 [compost metagenome]
MGVVLAGSGAQGEGLRSGGLDAGRARGEGHVLVQALHQADQCRAVARLATHAARKRAQGGIGRGQGGAAQVG